MNSLLVRAETFVELSVSATSLYACGSVPVGATLRYEQTDPYAVTTSFGQGYDVVTWSYARGLLLDGISGMEGRVGMGDVRVCALRGLDKVALELYTPDAENTVLIPREPLANFLDATLRIVPEGDESRFLRPAIEAAVFLLTGLTEENYRRDDN